MKRTLKLIFYLAVGCGNLSQLQSQQVIAPAGKVMQNGQISLEWTLGEPVIATLSGNNSILTQGFQQSNLLVTVIEELQDIHFAITVYPNPTDNLLMIRLDKTDISDFHYILYDVNGKLIEQQQPVSDITTIDFSGYAAGIYLLKVVQSENVLKTVKISKY